MLAVECVQSPVVAAEEKKPEGKEMQKNCHGHEKPAFIPMERSLNLEFLESAYIDSSAPILDPVFRCSRLRFGCRRRRRWLPELPARNNDLPRATVSLIYCAGSGTAEIRSRLWQSQSLSLSSGQWLLRNNRRRGDNNHRWRWCRSWRR